MFLVVEFSLLWKGESIKKGDRWGQKGVAFRSTSGSMSKPNVFLRLGKKHKSCAAAAGFITELEAVLGFAYPGGAEQAIYESLVWDASVRL